MIDGIKKQPVGMILIACSVVFLLLASAVSGCQVEDFVKVDVPNGIAEATASEPTIPLSKADATFEDWKAYVERNTRQFTEEIDRGPLNVFGLVFWLTPFVRPPFLSEFLRSPAIVKPSEQVLLEEGRHRGPCRVVFVEQ